MVPVRPDTVRISFYTFAMPVDVIFVQRGVAAMDSRRRDLHDLVDEIPGVHPDIPAATHPAILVLPHIADPV